MYAYIRGRIAAKKADRIIMEAGGIGYNVFFPAERISTLPPQGSECTVYTYTSVREDAIQLYGFSTEDELELYRQLLTVSGVGPKVALSLISSLTTSQIRLAIVSADVKSLCKAPGLGKKNAERIIVDLKGKIDPLTDVYPADEVEQPAAEEGAASEAAQALAALGYPLKDARLAVSKAAAEGAQDTEALLKADLRYMV